MRRITLFAGTLLGLAATSVVLADGMTVRKTAAENGAFIRNDSSYAHQQAPNLDFDTDGLANGPVIVASETTDSSALNNTGGFFANSNTAVIWNKGTGPKTDAVEDPHAAFLYILDEDMWMDSDSNPYDNCAIKAYVDANGVWTADGCSPPTGYPAFDGNTAPLSGATGMLQGLSAYSYEIASDDQDFQAGYAEPRRALRINAAELQQVLPEAVSSNADGEMWVNYSQITPVLIEAIKEQQALIEELRERLDRLDGGSGSPTW